jgi:hypothetical protein
MALGGMLKKISERDPTGTPSPAAAAAFASWLASVGRNNREPRYFDDVRENFVIESNSNKDLFTLFEMLNPYVDIPDDDDWEEEQPRSFIGLPMA